MASLSRTWLDVTRAALFDELYRSRSVLCIGVGDGRLLELLLGRGASYVVGIDSDAAAAELAADRLRGLGLGNCEIHAGAATAIGGRFDVVLVADAARIGDLELPWHEALGRLRDRVNPGGWMVAAAVPAEDAPPGSEGVLSYGELHDALAPHFRAVTMFGQLDVQGSALAPYGLEEVAPVLDASLLEESSPVCYVAIAGPSQVALGYGMVLLSQEATSTSEASAVRATAVLAAELEVLRSGELQAEREIKRLRLELEAATAMRNAAERRATEAAAAQTATVERANDALASQKAQQEQLVQRENALVELRASALAHAREMQAMHAALEERDAYVAELERGMGAIEPLRNTLAETTARLAEAEAKERAARLRAAELEGALLRLQREQSHAPAGANPQVVQAMADEVAELKAALAKQRARAEELQREAWMHLKSRSEAEAAAAEVREDTVRKLKDARKVANLELMRAMEEATKKAVALKEELVRTERERKEAVTALKQARDALLQVDVLRDEVERLRSENQAHAQAAAEPSAAVAAASEHEAAMQALREELERTKGALLALEQAPPHGVREAAAGDGNPTLVEQTLARTERRNQELTEELSRVRQALLQMPTHMQLAALERRNHELEDELYRTRAVLSNLTTHRGQDEPETLHPLMGDMEGHIHEHERLDVSLPGENDGLEVIEEGVRRVDAMVGNGEACTD